MQPANAYGYGYGSATKFTCQDVLIYKTDKTGFSDGWMMKMGVAKFNCARIFGFRRIHYFK
jgi:hypothetical protein